MATHTHSTRIYTRHDVREALDAIVTRHRVDPEDSHLAETMDRLRRCVRISEGKRCPGHT
jgi:hypothetical protein